MWRSGEVGLMRWSARAGAENTSCRSAEGHGPCMNHAGPRVQGGRPCATDWRPRAVVEVGASAATSAFLASMVVVVVVPGRCAIAMGVMTRAVVGVLGTGAAITSGRSRGSRGTGLGTTRARCRGSRSTGRHESMLG
jgi:hypothetical protein